MKKINILFFTLLLTLFFFKGIYAQVSYGEKPLWNSHSFLRNSEEIEFFEMPSFNPDSILIAEGPVDQKTRSSFSFAHKFYTKITKGIDGTETILPDGTKVWRVGIRSEGAYSINVLFTEFDIPEGGKLFLYNTDQSHLIGSFDHRNNSSKKLLPVRPVAGEAIIIEYSEPENVEFEGKLTIGEVNHDYRDILKREPSADRSEYLCMPDVLCEDADDSIIRATVLLMINGTSACTGTLINNTENDGTPYLLTAVHCFNPNAVFPQEDEYYIESAGTIITFFNYNRPVCGSKMKGTQDMSVAIAHPKVIIEKKDIALLQLNEKPPAYYNAYYAGWNINSTANTPPYINIHHPGGGLKKYGLSNNSPTLGSWTMSQFDRDSHWIIKGWNTGSTYSGSSGSALFDPDHLIIGGLTGGSSACYNTAPNGNWDYFFALHKGWETDNPVNQLKTYLDPNDKGITRLEGYDPHYEDPFIRISNMQLNTTDTLELASYESPNEGYLFGNSNLEVLEFAEGFETEEYCNLQGVYLFIPQMPYLYTGGVEIKVYSGDSSPENLLESKAFTPEYLNYALVYRDQYDFIPYPTTTSSVPTEHFVYFDNLYVGRKFYVSYKINYSTTNKFVIYNSGSNLDDPVNTAWIKDENDHWVSANEYAVQPVSTSLAIQALVQHTEAVSIPSINLDKKESLVYLKDENILLLPDTETDGYLYIYSINGQLISKHSISGGENSVSINKAIKGSVGIARFISGENVYTSKFIY